jgi:O-methyltransferase / aklanonic acid methyltransferase
MTSEDIQSAGGASDASGMTDEAIARKAQLAAMFDRLAPHYDAVGPASFAYFGRRLVEQVGIEVGDRVLDVACGRGAVLFPAVERVGAAGEVVGIDFSQEMVLATNAEAQRRGLAPPARVMDAERLDFADATFSRVLCGFGLMFFPHLDRALAEFRRVLKPGGRIGVSTWQISQADDVRAVLDEIGVGGPGEPGWITDPAELSWLLVSAGFSNVTVTVDSHAFRYADLDEYWRTVRGTGERRRLDLLGAAETERVRAALAERLAPCHTSDGLHIRASALLASAAR